MLWSNGSSTKKAPATYSAGFNNWKNHRIESKSNILFFMSVSILDIYDLENVNILSLIWKAYRLTLRMQREAGKRKRGTLFHLSSILRTLTLVVSELSKMLWKYEYRPSQIKHWHSGFHHFHISLDMHYAYSGDNIIECRNLSPCPLSVNTLH